MTFEDPFSSPIMTPVAVYGPTNMETPADNVRRYAAAIELIPEKEQFYRDLHADVWPEVVAAIKYANIRNYSIFATTIEGKRYLISYFEYTGVDPEKDFAKMAADPTTRDKWWPLTDACQRIIDGVPEGEKWLPMESVMLIP